MGGSGIVAETMADTKQRLVFAIIEFLNDSINDGTVKEDDKEGLEIAGASSIVFILSPNSPTSASIQSSASVRRLESIPQIPSRLQSSLQSLRHSRISSMSS